MNIGYHILASTLVISYNGRTFKLPKESNTAVNIINLIKEERFDEIPELVDIAQKIKSFTKEKFVIQDGVVYSYGKPVNDVMTAKIIEFNEKDLPFDYLLNFWNNLRLNPLESAQNELFQYLEKNEVPLTPDGHFIAYKKVTNNFKDIYTNTIDNSPGSKPEMNRDAVDPDRRNECSYGLHVAAWHYAKYEYGSSGSSNRMIEVKVNPKDVVSVPMDYNMQKMRVCYYEVISEIFEEHDVIILDDEKYTSEQDTPETYDVLTPTCFGCGMPSEACECDLDDDGIDNEDYTEDDEYFTCTTCNEPLTLCTCLSDELESCSDENVNTKENNDKVEDIKYSNKVKLGNVTYIITNINNTDEQEFIKCATENGAVYRKPSRHPQAFSNMGYPCIIKVLRRTLGNNAFRYYVIAEDNLKNKVFLIIE